MEKPGKMEHFHCTLGKNINFIAGRFLTDYPGPGLSVLRWACDCAENIVPLQIVEPDTINPDSHPWF